MNNTKGFPQPCGCILRVQERLVKDKYEPLHLVVNDNFIPRRVGMLTFSRLVEAHGAPASMMLIEFNFCPFCGQQLRLISKQEETDGSKANVSR